MGHTISVEDDYQDQNVGSLQAVKESLRRLRWRRERLQNMSSGMGHDTPSGSTGGPVKQIAGEVSILC